MNTFAFRARGASGLLIEGKRSALDEHALRRALLGEGLFLVAARRRAAPKASRRRVETKELCLFLFQLNGLVEAGIPLLGGLDDLAKETKNPALSAATFRIIESLQSGDTLAKAMERHPNVFEPLLVRMIEAGEATGRLAEVTRRLVEILEWREEVRGRVRDLVRYPLTVLTAIFGLVGLLLGFVFPRFSAIFAAVPFEMPFPTRVLLALSYFVRTGWPILLVVAVGAFVGGRMLLKSPRVRLALDTVALRAPIVGPFVRLIEYGRATKFLASFLDAGIPITAAMDMVSRMAGNRRVALRLHTAQGALLAGESISGALRASEVFPSMVIRLVVLGEESGGLVRSLEKAAMLFDRELPSRTKALLEALNPILTFTMGGILLFVVLAVMMPIYALLQAIGG